MRRDQRALSWQLHLSQPHRERWNVGVVWPWVWGQAPKLLHQMTDFTMVMVWSPFCPAFLRRNRHWLQKLWAGFCSLLCQQQQGQTSGFSGDVLVRPSLCQQLPTSPLSPWRGPGMSRKHPGESEKLRQGRGKLLMSRGGNSGSLELCCWDETAEAGLEPSPPVSSQQDRHSSAAMAHCSPVNHLLRQKNACLWYFLLLPRQQTDTLLL